MVGLRISSTCYVSDCLLMAKRWMSGNGDCLGRAVEYMPKKYRTTSTSEGNRATRLPLPK